MPQILEAPHRLSAQRQVSREYVRETLSIYRSESILVDTAVWDGSTLSAILVAHEYPFTRPGLVTYLTATMANLYASQLAYIIGRLLIEDSERHLGSTSPLTKEDFFVARDCGALRIVDVQFRCRRPIPLVPFSATVTCIRVRGHDGQLFAMLDHEYGARAFVGRTTVVIPRHDSALRA